MRLIEVFRSGTQRVSWLRSCMCSLAAVSWLLAAPVTAQSLQPGWAQVFPQGETPPAPSKHQLVYDAARKQTVMLTPTETWVYDGTAWTKKTGTVLPPEKAGIVYDEARQRVVAFGGGPSGSYSSTTMLWDGNTWTYWWPPDNVTPPGRANHGMAYDARRQRVVIYGGHRSGSYLRHDTWEWDGTRWTEVTTQTHPGDRQYFQMVYDAQRGHVVLYGGVAWYAGDSYGDTWTYDGAQWTRLNAGGPGPRFKYAMTHDPVSGKTVLFGGEYWVGSTKYHFNDTWEWDGTRWMKIDSQGVAPSARSSAAMAFDTERGRAVLFGGFDKTVTHWLNDTWEYTVFGAGGLDAAPQ